MESRQRWCTKVVCNMRHEFLTRPYLRSKEDPSEGLTKEPRQNNQGPVLDENLKEVKKHF